MPPRGRPPKWPPKRAPAPPRPARGAIGLQRPDFTDFELPVGAAMELRRVGVEESRYLAELPFPTHCATSARMHVTFRPMPPAGAATVDLDALVCNVKRDDAHNRFLLGLKFVHAEPLHALALRGYVATAPAARARPRALGVAPHHALSNVTSPPAARTRTVSPAA